MKAKRQALIREIVESQSIQTQEELGRSPARPRHGGYAGHRFARHQGNAPAQSAC